MDLEIEQGDDFSWMLVPKDATGTVVNVQGCYVHCQARSQSAAGPVVWDISTTNGGIVISTDNTITCSLTAAQTLLLKAVTTVYDVKIMYQGKRVTLDEGSVIVTPEVTQG